MRAEVGGGVKEALLNAVQRGRRGGASKGGNGSTSNGGKGWGMG